MNSEKKICDVVELFVKKILYIDKEHETLNKKLIEIDKLIDNLLDYCIKKKIYYYIENKISYTDINEHFKNHLENFLQQLIDPSNTLIQNYIDESECDNYSNVSSMLLNKFKSNTNDNSIFITNKNINKLGIYIKILSSQKKNIIEFTDKILYMCNILTNDDINYNVENPYA